MKEPPRGCSVSCGSTERFILLHRASASPQLQQFPFQGCPTTITRAVELQEQGERLLTRLICSCSSSARLGLGRERSLELP